jgi:uncharacterized repeat protein (TIGR02543 family)
LFGCSQVSSTTTNFTTAATTTSPLTNETTLTTTNVLTTSSITLEKFTVSFDYNGGSSCDDITDISFGSKIILPIPNKDGYTFLGWYLSSLPNAAGFNETSLVTQNLVLIAHWALQKHLVTFLDFDGTVLSSQYVEHGTSAIEPKEPLRTGYYFNGWDVNFNFIENDLIVTAQYEERLFKIYFDVSEGQYLEPVIDNSYNDIINLPKPVKYGYDFLGWTLNNSLVANNLVFNYDSDITLKALWQEIPEGLIYYETEWEIVLVEYVGEASFLILPDTINQKQIKRIPRDMFHNNLVIETIVLGKYINIIEMQAFHGTSNLKQIIIPEDSLLNRIEIYAFYESGLVSIDLPSSLEYIDEGAFENCLDLRWVHIPSNSNLKSIDRYAFRNDQNLNSIAFPASLTFLGESSFENTTRLWNVTFAENINLSTIERRTFYQSGLYQIEIPASILTIGNYAFSYCIYLNSLTFAENSQIHTIGYETFSNNSVLMNIVFPASLEVIGSTAFAYNDSLTSVTFEEGSQLYQISDYAFYQNYNLRYIDLPKNLLSIGPGAFEECSSLTYILIPDTVTTMGSFAFYLCNDLTIYSPQGGKLPSWSSLWYDDVRPVVWGIYGFDVSGDFVYAIIGFDSVQIVGKYYFSEATTLIIPETINGRAVTNIQSNAFKSELSITAVIIPNSITVIESGAFANSVGTIYAYPSEKPATWDPDWNPDSVTVVWGYNPE